MSASNNTENEGDKARSRIERVFRFLQELHKIRTPPKQNLNDYDWTLSTSDLPSFPTIEIGEAPIADPTIESDRQSFLLRVARPKETSCPEPPEEVREWLEKNWRLIETSADIIESRNFINSAGKTYTERFDSKPERVRLLSEWKVKREQWVEAELPARDAAAVYSSLYKLLGQIDRESEKYQLYLGDGILKWHSESGDLRHPLILLRVNLEFDSNAPQFSITASEHDIDLYVSLLRYAQVDGRVLARCKEKISTEQPHPFDGEKSKRPPNRIWWLPRDAVGRFLRVREESTYDGRRIKPGKEIEGGVGSSLGGAREVRRVSVTILRGTGHQL